MAPDPFPEVDPAHAARFIRETTRPDTPPLVPELRLYLASEVVPLWQMTEEDLAARGLPPPFWAFAWAGGQALARYILDHADLVAGKRVLDFATGSGIVAVAAAKAGAAQVTAADIDPFAAEAVRLNGNLNEVALAVETADLVGRDDLEAEIILAGDICYEQPLAGAVEAWLRGYCARGITVLIGDPGRTHLPKTGVTHLATYTVEKTGELEDCATRRTGVWRMDP